MKVLIVCTEKLPVPPIRGGAIQTYIAGALPTLSKNHEITVLGRSDESLPNNETVDGINYVRVQGGLLETYQQGVVKYIQNEQFDVIHIFNRPRLVGPIREVAPTSRLILSMHNDMFKREKISQEEGARAVQEVEKIITISNYIGETIVSLFPEAEGKTKTIYSGVDLDKFVPAYTSTGKKIRNEIRSAHDLLNKKVILFAGRLSANKGADILIQALPDLSKKHPDLAVVLVGSKWFSDDKVTDYVAYVRALAERMPLPVITTGFVSPEEIHKWFAAADIFVCPSQWQEPLARVHYEAMAAGLPIITTARGGNPEVIENGKNGFIVDNPEDPQSFVDHLSPLLSDDSLRTKMGKYGRSLAEQQFHWSRVVNDIMEVWNEVESNIANNSPLGGGTVTLEEGSQANKINEQEINSDTMLQSSLDEESSVKDELEVNLELANNHNGGMELNEPMNEETIPERTYQYENNPPTSPFLMIRSYKKKKKRLVRRR